MRIAYIAPYQGPALLKQRPIIRNLSLAAKIKMEATAEMLQRKSHSVEILSQGEVVESRFKFYPCFQEPDSIDGNTPIYYSSALPVRFLNGLSSSLSLLRIFKARHRVSPFEAVMIYNLKPAQVTCANYAIHRLGLPVILDYADDAFSGVWGSSGTALTSRYYLSKARRLLGSVSACIACTPYLLTQASASTPKLLLRGIVNKHIANPNGWGNVPRKNRVVFSGTHERTQGLEQLVMAWQTIKAPDWELHIAGQGPITATLQKLAANNRGIVFHGFLNREENARLLYTAKIGMNPQDAPRILGGVFAFKIIEYLAAGLHVITTPRGPVEPELEAGITYIKENSTETIAAGLNNVVDGRLFEHTAKDAALQSCGPEAVAQSFDVLFKKVVTIAAQKKRVASTQTQSNHV